MYPAYTTNTNDILYDPMGRYNQESNLVYRGSETSLQISEKSYPPLFTSEELAKYAILLYYSLTWHFYTLLANNILCFFISYEIFFDPDINEEIFVVLLKSLSNVLVIADSLITIYQYWNRVAVHRITYECIGVGLLITQSTTLLIVIILGLKAFSETSLILDSTLLVLYILRYYKLGLYVRLMHRVPGQMKLRNIFGKNLLILTIVIHTLVCIWMNLGCLEETKVCDMKYAGPGSYWNDGVHAYLINIGKSKNHIPIYQLTPLQNYLICLYYIMGGLTHVG
nr:uncharacterized protein LOC111421742 [Onthophagus taurus]